MAGAEERISAQDILLRFCMSLADAEQVCARLVAERDFPSGGRLRELVWLRAVFIEQCQRTPIAERRRFAQRADRILERLASVHLSDATNTVGRNEKC